MAARSISQRFLGNAVGGGTFNVCGRCMNTRVQSSKYYTCLPFFRTLSTTKSTPAKAKSTKNASKKSLQPLKRLVAEPAALPDVDSRAAEVSEPSPRPRTSSGLHSTPDATSQVYTDSPAASTQALTATNAPLHVNAHYSTPIEPIQDPTVSFPTPLSKADPVSNLPILTPETGHKSNIPTSSQSSTLKPETRKDPLINTDKSLGVEAGNGHQREVSPIKRAFANTLDKVLPREATEAYVAYANSEELFKECKKQGEYFDGIDHADNPRFWYTDCGLPVSLYSWAQITTLHMWTIMVRLRYINPEPRDRVQTWQQHFVNHLFYDLEDMMVNRYKIKSSSQRTKYLKEFNEQFRGAIAAYDEGMVRGDATLATAMWRNLWDANAEVDFQKLAMMVAYVRRIVSGLENVGDEVILESKLYFGNPADEEPLVVKLANEGRKSLETWKAPAKAIETGLP